MCLKKGPLRHFAIFSVCHDNDSSALMAVRDALAVNRRVFMTGHNDDHSGVRQAPVEFPMRMFPIRVN